MSDTYTVFIVLETDSEKFSFLPTSWWTVDRFHSLDEAMEKIEEMREAEYSKTGIYPAELDD